MSDMTLEELSARTIVAANTLTLKPGQENYVAPVSHSIAEAYVNPTTAWPRVVVEDGGGTGAEPARSSKTEQERSPSPGSAPTPEAPQFKPERFQ